ncbi:hypothetical protein ACUM5Y_05995 [Marinomonas dokdonensis]|uniref:hypothetical protein n=1 Tax=Marinomonas dokdonensis TaxID=328224 RepID=UPI0040559596
MNKKQFLDTYRKVSRLSTPSKTENKPEQKETYSSQKPLYRSPEDERLIKDLHFAKFQKNLENLHKNEELKLLIEKTEWDENDIQSLLKSLR